MTRPLSPGWRADSRIASGRSVVSGRLARISAASDALAAHRSNRASASSVSRSASALAATNADSSSRMRATSSASATCASRQALPELDRDERLDEQRLAAARRVVDDALDPRAGLGLDRDHVAAVAERDDRLLEGVARAPSRRASRAGGGAARRRPGRPSAARRAAATRCRAARRPGRSCAPASSAARAGAWSSRPSSRRSGRRSSARSVASRAVASSVSAISRNCAGSRRPPRAARSTAGPMSRAAPIPTPGPLLEERPRLVGLVEAARDEDRVVRWLERLGQPARRRERRWPRRAAPGSPGTRAGSSERSSMPPVSRRSRAGADAARARDRRMAALDEPPGLRVPWLARVVDPDPGVASIGRGRSSRRRRLEPERRSPGRTGRARSSRCPARMRPRRARAAGEPFGRQRGDPCGLRGRALGRQAPSAAPSSGGRDRAASPRSPRAARPRGRAPRPGRARVRSPRSGSRTSRRQGTRRRARRPEHDPVPGGLAEAGVRCPVVAPDVRLDLDDPPDASAGRVVADQARADESAGGLEGGSPRGGPVEDAQRLRVVASGCCPARTGRSAGRTPG